MRESWEKAIKFVLDHEGGYVFDPADPGGETRWGISKRSYPSLNIKDLTEEQAKEIYMRDDWIPSKCDDLPWPLDIVTFDSAVQHGVQRVRMWNIDNAPGLLFRRLKLYVNLAATNPKFLRGWANRIIDLYEEIRQESLNFDWRS